jgi:hypothetical protein
MQPIPNRTLAADLRRLVEDDAADGQALAIATLAAYIAHDARPGETTLERLIAARSAWANGRAEQARKDGIAFAVFLASAWSLALFALFLSLAK